MAKFLIGGVTQVLAGVSSRIVAVVTQMDPLVVTPRWATTTSAPFTAVAYALIDGRADA